MASQRVERDNMLNLLAFILSFFVSIIYASELYFVPIPDLNVNQIFSTDKSFLEKIPENQKITLLVTGDVLLARLVNQKMVTSGNFNYPFEKTADFLKDADLTFINLEGPLLEGCPIITDGTTFCGDPRDVQALTFAGIDIANLANNHIYNFGSEGLSQTLSILDQNGIAQVGIVNPVYKEIKGLKFAFLGYNAVGIKVDTNLIKGEVSAAKSQADIVVVQYHWGTEYTYIPKRFGADPVELGHLTIDAGADLVIGNHPHRIQGVEIYKGKVIAYSHGNFVFDQFWSTETRVGVVGEYTFYQKKLVDVTFHPIWMEKVGQPVWQGGGEKQEVLDLLKTISQNL